MRKVCNSLQLVVDLHNIVLLVRDRAVNTLAVASAPSQDLPRGHGPAKRSTGYVLLQDFRSSRASQEVGISADSPANGSGISIRQDIRKEPVKWRLHNCNSKSFHKPIF